MKKNEITKENQLLKKNSKIERLLFLFKEHVFYYMCVRHRDEINIHCYFSIEKKDDELIKSLLPIKTKYVDYILINNTIKFIFHKPFFLKWKIMVSTQPREFYYNKWEECMNEIEDILNELSKENETNI